MKSEAKYRTVPGEARNPKSETLRQAQGKQVYGERSRTISNFVRQLTDRISNFFFYFLILFLPTQLGRHFWPDFSLVSGIRVDYLAPTIYLTDVLILILFVDWIVRVCHRERSHVPSGTWRSVAIPRRLLLRLRLIAMTTYLKYLKFVVLVVFVIFLIFGILLSKNQLAGLYGFLKLLEFVFLGFYTALNMKKLRFDIILFLFSVGIIFESFLSVAQYLNRGSIGGIFYFFGERTFNGQTPGIANASINGQLILRPYGTFSHPNVLAGYLVIAMTIVISNLKTQNSKLHLKISNVKKIIYILSVVVGTIALFLTMSRAATLLWLFILIFIAAIGLKKRYKNKFTIYYLLFTILIISSIFLLSPLRFRFADIKLTDESIAIRQELIKSSFLMIKNNPFFGVGLNNFLVELPRYQKINNYFTDLQPAHNIYLLILAQIGVAGLVFFLWFIVNTYQKLKTQSFDKLRSSTPRSLRLEEIDPFGSEPQGRRPERSPAPSGAGRSRTGQNSKLKATSQNLKLQKKDS